MMVINGGFVMNLALFLTMLILMAGRLPDYGEDTERTSNARSIYYMLLFFHLVYAIARYMSLFITKALKIYQGIFLFASIYLIVWICQGWVFREGRDWTTMDH